jgi:uncharacterized protein (TIGR03435 family)
MAEVSESHFPGTLILNGEGPRPERIYTARIRDLANIRTYLFLAAAVVASATVVSSSHAQDAGPLAFEVATVKLSNPNRPQPPSLKLFPNRFETMDMPLSSVIAIAYNLTYGADQQISGAPAWIRSEKFDIVAKEDETVSARMRKLSPEQQGDESRLMIQALLADRFNLRVHRETRELSTYVLVLARGGPKLKPVVLNPHLPADIPQSRINVMGKGWLEGHDCDMALLTKMLGSLPEVDGRTVIDKSGLKGKYDFTLKWTPDSTADPAASGTGTAISPDARPSFFTALQEQLGLRLASTKDQVEVILFDGVDKPSAN